ncbi:hypothetical protein RvY_00708 [Ramazzottius varieornatus]|uniref:Uncharacterized protein n=1 Tax=Ramazzottius varieornatus TaxID=947166 RepID=A0A1D1UJX9_RAMVA|nr:hypothetical protein RvY_00708 [Ramazzottius varieornatus]
MSPGLLRQPPVQPVPVFPGAFIPLPYPGVVPYFPYFDGYVPPGFISQFGGLNIVPNRFYNPGFGPPLNFPAYQRRSERASYASADHRGSGGDFQQPSSHFACPNCSEKRPASVATSVNSDLACCASCSGCDVSRPNRTETSRRKHGSTGCGASDPCRKSATQTPFDDLGVDVSALSPRSCQLYPS